MQDDVRNFVLYKIETIFFTLVTYADVAAPIVSRAEAATLNDTIFICCLGSDQNRPNRFMRLYKCVENKKEGVMFEERKIRTSTSYGKIL